MSRYYHTDWMPEDELHLSIDGLNMDAVSESLVRQIAGDKLQTDSSESLKESVERDEKKKQLEKQIAVLKRTRASGFSCTGSVKMLRVQPESSRQTARALPTSIFRINDLFS